ncbi:hypothetical protein CRG98_008954 [Punica granatum]|uniref:Uncharacterized protein n=1 Tax=Punica granatum TaxID=22663 RepID=A0A2I0KQI2_PUNGR|nr:hypothetical protein CRG98_008954 [Punica granatum]
MTRSVPTSLAGVTHYGDYGANFNQGDPSGVPPCRAPSLSKYMGGGSRGVLEKARALASLFACGRRVPVKDDKEDDVLGDYAACASILGRARGVGSPEDKRVEQVGRPLVHGSPCHGGKVKAAGGLPAKVGTTRLSYRVGGRDGQPLVTARLALER